MEIEYKLDTVGLSKIRDLKEGDTFVEGGLMNSPKVYLVINTCCTNNGRDCVAALGMRKGDHRYFEYDKLIARVDCKLVVMGYTDPRTPRDF